jgi:hypothetical protein
LFGKRASIGKASVQVFGGQPESNPWSFGQKRSLSEIQTMVRHDLRVNSRFDARVIKHKDQDGSGFLERNWTLMLLSASNRNNLNND